jgi:adenylate kinase family enzyme
LFDPAPHQAKKAMESGALVSDEIVVGLIKEAMDK